MIETRVLTGDALFEAKMSELCRDLGERGRVDVGGTATSPPESCQGRPTIRPARLPL